MNDYGLPGRKHDLNEHSEPGLLGHSSHRQWRDIIRRDDNGASVESESQVTEDDKLEINNDGWLNLTNVGPRERGWYQCVSDHEFGEHSSNSVFINVQSKYYIRSYSVMKMRWKNGKI